VTFVAGGRLVSLFHSLKATRAASKLAVILTDPSTSIAFAKHGITEFAMATTVTVKGQVTLPKAIREAAGIRPGDRVEVRVRPEGGVIIEAEATFDGEAGYRRRLEDMSRRKPLRGMPTEDIMAVTRGED
jgi:antitoxin PrlF